MKKNTILCACGVSLMILGCAENESEAKPPKVPLSTAPIIMIDEGDNGLSVETPCVYSSEELISHFELPSETSVSTQIKGTRCWYSLQHSNIDDASPMQNFHAEIFLNFEGWVLDTQGSANELAQTMGGKTIDNYSVPAIAYQIDAFNPDKPFYYVHLFPEGGSFSSSLKSVYVSRSPDSGPISKEYKLDKDKYDELVENIILRVQKTPATP